jgi:hypothetical protein
MKNMPKALCYACPPAASAPRCRVLRQDRVSWRPLTPFARECGHLRFATLASVAITRADNNGTRCWCLEWCVNVAANMHNDHRPLSPAMRAASEMPPLKHWLGHDPSFSITRSEVAQWLITQPECVQFLFNAMKNAGMIEFDMATKKWVGIHWESKDRE